jgi:LmbE family N-acetylglucosaminyl deacetylase
MNTDKHRFKLLRKKVGATRTDGVQAAAECRRNLARGEGRHIRFARCGSKFAEPSWRRNVAATVLNLLYLLNLFNFFCLSAQSQTQPQAASYGTGASLPEAVEAIQQARVTTRILYVTAHPDDESSSALTYLARGLGADVALLSITRGEGGQNALGPEQGAALGMVRSEELLAATRVYGTRLYFTRAPDFGYSKSAEETLRIWGRGVVDDIVQVIRTFRPHIVINHWGGARGGHGQHQAAGIVTPQAVAAAADANYIPFEVDTGRNPWRVEHLLQLARGDAASGWSVPADEVSPLWGRSYAEIGRDGFVSHRTQGIAAFLSSPFLRRTISLARADGQPFEPVALAEPVTVLARRFPEYEAQLRPALEECDAQLAKADAAARALDWPAAARALAAAWQALEEARRPLFPPRQPAANRLSGELGLVLGRIEQALAMAAGLQLEVRADRSRVVAGESFTVRAAWRHRRDVPLEFEKPVLFRPPGWTVEEEQAEAASGRFTVSIPAGAEAPRAADEWMLPWPPPLVSVSLVAKLGDARFRIGQPALALRATSTRAEIVPLALVPAVTIGLQPRRIFLRTRQAPPKLDVLARVHYFGSAPVKVTVGLQPPEGWNVPPEQEVEFAEAGDVLVHFAVTPPAAAGARGLPAGAFHFTGYAKRKNSGASSAREEVFASSLEPLPSLPVRLWTEPAAVRGRVFDVAIPAGLRVGYVSAGNDPVPEVLHQLGVEVQMLDEVQLAFGNLARFDAIAIGIRAYELRDDLARANPRLLEYVRAGGTLVVQYQRESVWNALKPAPYPATGSALRITDENSPVRYLAPEHPVLTAPNKIAAADFTGWVQERGLYFWSAFDPQYQPVLALRDPGEEELTGGLLFARHGKGVYIYTGLSFFRQLPEGVPGALRLFVNLLAGNRK